MPKRTDSPEDPAHGSEQVHRLDGPHLSGGTADEPAVVPAETLNAAAGLDQARNPDQFRAQASQVARHLRQRRTDIDRREAELNARISQLESEVRLSRLWMQERSHEFEQRESELQKEVTELQNRLQTVATVELADEQEREREESNLHGARQELERREHELHAGQQRLAEEAERLAAMRSQLQAEQEQQQRQALLARQDLLRQQESLVQKERNLLRKLGQHRESLEYQERQLLHSKCQQQTAGPRTEYADQERDRQQLEAQRRQLDEARQQLREETRQAHRQAIAERERIAHSRRVARREAQTLRSTLDERRQALERRETSLVQLKDQIGSLYREVLEMRLVTEQLWGEVREAVSPAEITRSISKLRGRLADQYRFAQQQLLHDKEELRQLAKKLDASRNVLLRQRDEFHAWATRRQQEAEEQAARLVAQEGKLNRDQERLRELERQLEADC